MLNNKIINVTVILPVYKDNTRLNTCIEALEHQFYPKENFEVIVVNNDPESNIEVTVPNSLDLRILTEMKPGSYTARNRGINEAKGDILAFTDSDCIPDSNWIENAITLFHTDEDISMIGGRIEQFRSENTSDSAFFYQVHFSFNQKKNVEEKNFSVTANLFAKKEVFSRVGLFNEKLFSGGDYEFGIRAKSKGVRLAYSDSVIVQHPMRKNLTQLIEKKRRTKGGAYDIQKNVPTLKSFIVCLIDPYIKSKQIDSSLNLNQKIRILSVSWILKFTELFEWIRVWIFDANRLRQ